MAYIGNEPRYSNYPSQFLSGNGVQTTFTMNFSIASTSSILVVVEGIKQFSNSYAVNGSQLVFSEAPPIGTNNIELIPLAVKGTVNSVGDGAIGRSQLADQAVGLNQIDSDLQNKFGGFKNKIIGGDFSINPWQRGTSFAAIGNAYCADRFAWSFSGTGVVSVLKTADAPTAAEAGLFTQHCLHVDVTTADASIAASDVYEITQRLEGYSVAPFGFGQAGTRYVTLSFWVKSAKTGIHCVALVNSAADRSYVKEYTVNAADTWEKKTLTFPIDTTGTWLYENGVGLRIKFTLAAGADWQTTADNWAAGHYTATANQVNELDSTANNFKIALVQLEAGEVATPFESRSYGQELTLSLRYCRRARMAFSVYALAGNGTSTTDLISPPMRDLPVVSSQIVNSSSNSTSLNISAGTNYVNLSYAAVAAGNTTYDVSFTLASEL